MVDGLDLQAIRVVSNVTIGGFGESTEVPLSTPSGGSLGDPAVQYPWRGQAVLSLGAVTGPFFGMDAIQAMTGANASEQAARSPAAAMRTSYDELVVRGRGPHAPRHGLRAPQGGRWAPPPCGPALNLPPLSHSRCPTQPPRRSP